MEKLSISFKSKMNISSRVNIVKNYEKFGLLGYPSKEITINKYEYNNPGNIRGGKINRSR